MKMYVKKIRKVEGINLFKGEEVSTIIIMNKTGHFKAYNLVGDYSCFETHKEIMLYSTTTLKPLYYGYIKNEEKRIVNDNTLGDYIVIK